jgi:hypothetical protein
MFKVILHHLNKHAKKLLYDPTPVNIIEFIQYAVLAGLQVYYSVTEFLTLDSANIY